MIHSEKAYREFFQSNINHLEKLQAIRKYLKNSRRAELFWDMSRETPYTVFYFSEDDTLGSKSGHSSLWKLVTYNVPLVSDNEKDSEYDLHVIDHIYRDAHRRINGTNY